MTQVYSEPVDRLLTLGRPIPWEVWRDYASLGVTERDVPELIRLATDSALLDAPSDDVPLWGPLHAWRALGELRTVEAIEPLLSLLSRIEEKDDDAVAGDAPIAFGLIGPATIEPLRQYAADAANSDFARVAAVEGIQHVGMTPRHRDACAAVLANLLDHPDATNETVNAFVVIALCALHAEQHAAAIERAFEQKRVETQVCGKFPQIRAELGLQSPPVPTRRFIEDDIERAIDHVLPPRPDQPTPDWMKEFLA